MKYGQPGYKSHGYDMNESRSRRRSLREMDYSGPIDAPNDPKWKEKLVSKMCKQVEKRGEGEYTYSQLSMWMEGALGESMLDKEIMTGGPDHNKWTGLVKEIADKVEEKTGATFSN